MTTAKTIQSILTGPLSTAFLFLGSVLAARSLAATFWLAPPLSAVVKFAPLPFLALLLFGQIRFFRQAEDEERAYLIEALQFAIIIGVSVLALGELFAFLGARLWDSAEIWHWVALLACLLGAHRARSRHLGDLQEVRP